MPAVRYRAQGEDDGRGGKRPLRRGTWLLVPRNIERGELLIVTYRAAGR